MVTLTTLATWAHTSFPLVSYLRAWWTSLFLAYYTPPWYYGQVAVQALLPRSAYVRFFANPSSANKLRSGRFKANALRKKHGLQVHRRKDVPWVH
jgi:hypothetical protein